MNGRQEHFFWDNLAMISRNETEYGDVLFNDLLGTTIGIRSGKEYRETGMTAFGETDEKAAMFTGKPYIGELGYAFLFRNCRPVSASGRPAIPSAILTAGIFFSSVNNGVTTSSDFLGADIYHIVDSKGAIHENHSI